MSGTEEKSIKTRPKRELNDCAFLILKYSIPGLYGQAKVKSIERSVLRN